MSQCHARLDGILARSHAGPASFCISQRLRSTSTPHRSLIALIHAAGYNHTIDVLQYESIQFLGDLRDFLKERADLEKEYSRKLEVLSRKFLARRERRKAALGQFLAQFQAVPGSQLKGLHRINYPVTESCLDWIQNRCWSDILKETESVARNHSDYSDSLNVRVVERIKTIRLRHEESRKKNLTFCQRLVAERDKIYDETAQAKHKYDVTCDLVDTAKSKHDRAIDERTREKHKLTYHQEILDMYNNKNLYILSLDVAKAVQDSYYNKTVPAIVKMAMDSGSSAILELHGALDDYVDLSLQRDQYSQASIDKIKQTIASLDGSGDADAFLAKARAGFKDAPTPHEFAFQSSGLWKETGEMSTDDFSRIFLTNKLEKIRDALDLVSKDIEAKHKAIEGLQKLYDTYTANPRQGDPYKAREGIDELEKEILLLTWTEIRYQTLCAKVTGTIGEKSDRDRSHSFKCVSCTIPTTCDYCRHTIWGVKAAVTCTVCNYNAHIKCELKVPLRCTGVKIKAQRSASNPSITRRESTPKIPEKALRRTDTPTTDASKVPLQAIVLYSYTPCNLSGGEIEVLEGESLTVLQPDDGSGWALVSSATKTGLVPTSYIKVIPRGTPLPLHIPANVSLSAQTLGCDEAMAKTDVPVDPKPAENVPLEQHRSESQATVLYEYIKQSDDEITVLVGQMVKVLDSDDGSGWARVSDGSQAGLVPSTYLQKREGI
ncbi:uncharacterized protein BJ171DRAFT_472287 [Polychytrium aggregatum]|uniref:uncharacterized protein n=1 Tax=Polychytrium aggregatum TaxID=110093 RepID=UPI0022FDCB4F|nr:uncharacterized protein BJ171DRAFT_472287 [Polychytrium aggregatum]KAI9208006.1 hypothetical protein BJ171DRAFT_472287 [Polychytrium aggregatum]